MRIWLQIQGSQVRSRPGTILCGGWSWNNFYCHSPPFRWFIQEGLLSVTSKSMCTNYLLTTCSSLPKKSVVRWTDCPPMTIAVDWDIKQQNKTVSLSNLLPLVLVQHRKTYWHDWTIVWLGCKALTQTKKRTGLKSCTKQTGKPTSYLHLWDFCWYPQCRVKRQRFCLLFCLSRWCRASSSYFLWKVKVRTLPWGLGAVVHAGL